MPIPKTRADLVSLIQTTHDQLVADLEAVDSEVAKTPCAADWSIKDLLAVRTRWTEMVADWVETGRKVDELDLPATGYTWKETPRLNSDIADSSRAESWDDVLARFERGVRHVFATIDSLGDNELLTVGAFAWAGRWPISRWISVNTATQYATARTYIRRALKARTSK